MSSGDDARYEEILRRIAANKQRAADKPAQFHLATVLDEVNAMGFLDDMRRKRLSSISYYGPDTFRGTHHFQPQNLPVKAGDGAGEQPSRWVGAVAWYKPRGYHHFRTLNLLGIWAVEATDKPQLIIATKSLNFDAPVFNPESYYRNIKRGFTLYYGDYGHPPDTGWLHEIVYDRSERLAVRETIQAVLATWAQSLRVSSS